jgi:hypothetical protein
MSTNQGQLAMLFGLLLLASEQASAGRLFEWVDRDGTTHFSDRPPVGVPFAEKTVRPASGAARPGNETGIRKAERMLLKNADHQNMELERAKRVAAMLVEQRKSRCSQARTRYQEAIHRPGSAGGGDYKAYRRKMKEVCD